MTGIGGSTLAAMRSLDVGASWWQAGSDGEMAAGNGAAMRAAPLAFCIDALSEEGRRTLRDVCRITHRNEEAYVGALAVVLAIHIAASGDHHRLGQLLSELATKLPDSRVRDRLITLETRKGDLTIEETGVRFRCGGYVVESVPFALYAAQHIASAALEDVFRSVIQAGGDTDTTASIAGQVCGAFLGKQQLPAKLVNLLPNEPPICSIAPAFSEVVANVRES
jgi:ADP-ribosylglycohydrolase